MLLRVRDGRGVGGLGVAFETEQQHQWRGGVRAVVEFLEIFERLSVLPAEVLLSESEVGWGEKVV